MTTTSFQFLDELKASAPKDRLAVLPVSVLEIGASGANQIRGDADHDSDSSRGGFSPFPFEVAELCASLYLRDSSLTLDPFSGWGERAEAMRRHNRPYIGYDCSQEAIAKAKEVYGVYNVLADSRTLDVPIHSGLITCPPYWNLETYFGDNGLDRSTSWESFLMDYQGILARFSDRAVSGSKYCIVTGDWRESGKYYDLTYQTESFMEENGFDPFDKVVISRLGISKIKIMLPQAKRLGYTVKVHETLSVFIKP